MWKLPLTMPRDDSLRFLGYSPRRNPGDVEVVGRIYRPIRRIICLLTHCEERFSGNPPMLAIYRAFLEWCAGNPSMRFYLPRDLIIEPDRLGDGAARAANANI